MTLHSFPKIFAVGTSYIQDLLQGEVEVTEKVDGSQFVFGEVDGKLCFRSKGQQLFLECVNKMFATAVEEVIQRQGILVKDQVYYCEYLQKPKHNVLTYNKVPRGHLALYAVERGLGSGQFLPYEEIVYEATHLGIDYAPLLLKGKVSMEDLRGCLQYESFLGGPKIEGVVVKDYSKKFLIGGQPMPLMAGKLVSEDFKEVHRAANNPTSAKTSWETFKEGYRTEARWLKAIQHLRDSGLLKGEPSDIGPLIREIRKDLSEECMAEIKAFLWKEFGEELLRKSVAGFPEWYKGTYLLEAK